jgi:hypothetical protein
MASDVAQIWPPASPTITIAAPTMNSAMSAGARISRMGWCAPLDPNAGAVDHAEDDDEVAGRHLAVVRMRRTKWLLEDYESAAIAKALEEKNILDARNELSELRTRLDRLEASLARRDQDLHRQKVDSARPQMHLPR